MTQRIAVVERWIKAFEKDRLKRRNDLEDRLDKIEATLQGIRRVIETARPGNVASRRR